MCDQVAERLALGEPLGDLSEHVSGCASCQGLVMVSGQLAGTHHAVDPGLGFSARMTVGAQHRLVVRRRRRLAAGLAVSVATGMFGVFLVAHHPTAPDAPQPTVKIQTLERDTPREPSRLEPATDDDLAALARIADVDSASRVSADWDSIEAPLAPYKKLVKGDAP
ncbi:MAG TPA: hypothetical protein VHT91_10195 [Kofleriaceae bacterium]|nr:hypothetical protein [Kofleriaceae bacterium]